MANNKLGNFSICNNCKHQYYSCWNESNKCWWSELASVKIQCGCTPKCNFYSPKEDRDRLITVWLDDHKNYGIKRVIFKDPLTIVLWNNGDKTIVKCQEGDIYDPEKGLAMAICKYMYGNKSRYNEIFKKWLPEDVSDGSEGNT